MSFHSPLIKTQIGQHDYHKPACFEYCKMSSQFCPFSSQLDREFLTIKRWTDLKDEELNSKMSGQDEDSSYLVSFVPSPVDNSISVNNAQLSQAIYTCWGDGSGFEYDKMSRNVIGQAGVAESVYDISRYGIQHDVLKQSEWNAWIDKFQYDYRFGRVSDTNAQCILFPNVDNPWMFTEYVFKGVFGDNSICNLQIPEQYVVQPPIYDPQTLQLVNGDFKTDVSKYDGKYRDFLSNLDDKGMVKQYRQIINWYELGQFSLSQVGGDQKLMNSLNAANSNLHQTTKDAGVKLYRAKIPVQSVKWGEHGNIPPHTLDMTAPKEWFDPQAGVGKLKAVYDAHVGSPFYAPRDGIVSWVDGEYASERGRQAKLAKASIGSEIFNADGKKRIQYSSSGGQNLDMPKNYGSQIMLQPESIVMGNPGQNDFCHKGCALCKGSNELLTCAYLEGLSISQDVGIQQMNDIFDSGCVKKGKNCPHYVQTGAEGYLIATYQMTMLNSYQQSMNLSKGAGYLGMAALGVAGTSIATDLMSNSIGDIYSSIINQVSSFSKRGDITITYTIRYQIQPSSKNEARLNKQPNKNDEFGKGVQIVPGTGKFAFDTEKNANVFSGGDTNVYNDISTLSFHRFFTSIMHCATQKSCNLFVGQSQALGYNVTEKAGGQGQCRYFNQGLDKMSPIGCPYNCAPKRAIQFAHVSQDVISFINMYMLLYENMSQYGIWELEAATKQDENGNGENSGIFYQTIGLYTKEKINQVQWVIFDEWAVARKSDTKVAMIAVRDVVNENKNINCSPYHGGAALLKDTCCPSGFLLFCQIRTKEKKIKIDSTPWYVSSSSSTSQQEQIEITTVECLQGFYWYYPVNNNGSSIYQDIKFIDSSVDGSETIDGIPLDIPESLWQHTDKNGYWFCKAQKNVTIPSTNCVIIDNEEKFIGGWHPEYKDYSKMGSEFMQQKVSDESRQGQGMGDYVNNGDYNPIPQKTSKEGYWVDQSGEYIIDQRSTGWDESIVSPPERENNNGPGVCISFKKSNTSTNPDTGETIPPKTISGAVFSNDPPYFWRGNNAPYKAKLAQDDWNLTGGQPWFNDPLKDQEYYAPCQINNLDLLPMKRQAVHCSKCDYYLSIKYASVGECPWCGTKFDIISGSEGSDKQEGDTWENDSVIKKFFKLNSIGNADVWAPAGTAVKTDAYFWRHQAQITNATRRQIYHRLGTQNESGVGKSIAKFDKMTAESELTLGFPESLGKFERVPYLTKTQMNKSSQRYGDIDWWSEEPSVYGMYNQIMPRHMIPQFFNQSDNGDQDEGMIAPYSEDSMDALKSVSFAEIINLRNALQPMYAYSSQEIYGTDYPVKRASYDDRTTINQPIIYEGRRALVKPIVLAHTCNSNDAYQEYYSGDMVYGNVRQYFPNGYTWWYMKQLLGGRYSNLEGGQYHMDTKQFGGYAPHVQYPISNRTIAQCAISIYGMLPLDKVIMKAYVIITPNGTDPSKDPIGRSWTGGPVMYHHYHAKTVTHYEDGEKYHLHGTAGYPEGTYFDEEGNERERKVSPGYIYSNEQINFQSEADTRLWGGYSEHIQDDRNMYYDDHFFDMMTSLPGLFDNTFYRNVGTVKKNINSLDEEDKNLYFGYDEKSFPDPAGWKTLNLKNTEIKKKQKYQYIILNTDGDIVQKYPNSMIWRTMTKQQIEQVIKNNTAEIQFKVSAGTQQSTVSYKFTEMNSDIYADLIPQQTQGIPGYFDMSWTNTLGYVFNDYQVSQNKNIEWNAPVIFQAEPKNPPNYSGDTSVNEKNMGTVSRCIDVTSIVKGMYNDRVSRDFHGKGGASKETIKSWVFYSPTIEGDNQIGSPNKQLSFSSSYGYLLIDSDTYPDLGDNIDMVPEINSDGDKYEMANKEAEIVFVISYPLVVTANNSTFNVDNNSGNIKTGRYTTYSEVESIISQIFKNCNVIKLSNNAIKVTKSSKITIKSFKLFNLENQEYAAVQNRIIQVSNFAPGYHPNNFINGTTSKWCYNIYTDQPQSFTVDLLRAPLLIKQQNWRYQQGYTDYSNCKCPNVNCKAHEMTCSVAANMSNIFFNGKNNKCPICGQGLSGGQTVDGDGIKTYFYDEMFAQDAFITKIEYTALNCNVRVLGRYSKHESWKILSNYDNATKVKTNLINESTRARFIKVECDSESQFVYHQYKIDSYTDYQVILSANQGSDFADLEKVSFENVKCVFGSAKGASVDIQQWFVDNASNDLAILSGQVVGQDKKHLRISLNKEISIDEDSTIYAQFVLNQYCGGVENFKVYGFHYKTKESEQDINGSKSKYLVITDAQDEFSTKIIYGENKYRIPAPPTQILGVYVGRNAGTLKLTQVDSQSSLQWTTEDTTISVVGETGTKSYKIKKITQGNYYYDVNRGYICLPTLDQNKLKMEEFEKELESTKSSITYIPNTLVMYYWSGNGKSVTLKVQADGHGPSYMLEKNAIRTIVNESALPSNGKSCKMISASTFELVKDKKIKWLCYNNKPVTLNIEQQSMSTAGQGSWVSNAGQFRVPTFCGQELAWHNGDNYDKYFISLFGNEASKCYGVCETEITLTGAPNQVITGDIKVRAEAETNTFSGKEKTGGIKQGFLIVTCAPSSGKRVTKCYNIPKLLIYARDANQDGT